jgi:hypothetical protein
MYTHVYVSYVICYKNIIAYYDVHQLIVCVIRHEVNLLMWLVDTVKCG